MLKYLSKFLYVLGHGKRQLPLMVFLFILNGLLDIGSISLVGPFVAIATSPHLIEENQLINQVYTATGVQSANHFIVILGITILVAFYFKSILYYWIQRYIFRFSYFRLEELQSRLLNSYLSVPYTFHLNRNSADLLHTINHETVKISNGAITPLLNLASNLIILIVLLFLLIITAPIATLIITILLGTTFLPYYRSRDRIRTWGKQASEAGIKMACTVNHCLGGLKETRVIGCEAHFERELMNYARVHTNAATAYNCFKLLPRLFTESVLITFLIGLACIFLLTDNQQNLTAVLSIFAMASIRLLPAVTQLASSVTSLKFSSHALHKIHHDLIELEQVRKQNQSHPSHQSITHNLPSQNGLSHTLPFNQDVVLEKITYCYPNAQEPALEGISLTLKKGESIALIGRSGAGKTTLVDLILGLLYPDSGDIRVDNTSIYNDLRAWQNLIGYIPQFIFLMDDTIEHNIAYGVPDNLIDYERLKNAIWLAQLSDLVAQLPQGIKTPLGERGVRLSGGQRQRIGIARALYFEREILVLDEATSALDNETETLVTDAIRTLSGVKTMIIIAHRLTTIEHCDRVYKMEKGQIVESGNYQEVILST